MILIIAIIIKILYSVLDKKYCIESPDITVLFSYMIFPFALFYLQCRVVTFLSPHFLESGECLEQFNIALVCNRTVKRSLLTPFYLITIDEMPTYMEMVQYIDCRQVQS